MKNTGPLVLLILDGWGYNPDNKHNAIAVAHTPQWDSWWTSQPGILLDASGVSVGLPSNQMGNSEVGHMHIGAGRIIQQDFTKINQSIDDGTFFKNSTFIAMIDAMKRSKKSLHIMGLFSNGGVHSHEEHLFAFLKLCHEKQYDSVCLHLFLDGRDTPPQSALNSLNRLQTALLKYPVGRIHSICGRYYAMDRDNRWDRIEPVYTLLTQGLSSNHFDNTADAIEYYYQNKISDEFIPPTCIGEPNEINHGDAVFFFNFRADRVRQLCSAFVTDAFTGFKRTVRPQLAYCVSMTLYDKNLPTSAAFPPEPLDNTFGACVANHGLKQFRIAETEKYAHVTFFFNGGNELTFPNETRVLVPSPHVATYDLQPEMSAPEVTAQLVEAIHSQLYDVIICNYANADMVGHSGNFEAAVCAIECLDQCMSLIGRALDQCGGCLLITADHGNAEHMFDETTHQAHTAHTTEPVPLLFVGKGWHFTQSHGSLIDVAPTALALLGITPPKDMTGHVLLEQDHVH